MLPLIFLAFALLTLLLRLYNTRKKTLPLPPGPSPLPLIGNLHQAPQTLPWRTFDTWRRQYGPIMAAQFGNQTLILVSSAKIAHELLEKRSTKYSIRPELVMASNTTKGLHMLIHQYDDWDLESKQLLIELLASNDFDRAFERAFERYSGSLLYALAYGYRLPTGREQALKDMRTIQSKFTYSARVGTWIVDAIPLLNHLPTILAPWKRVAQRLFTLESGIHTRNLERGLSPSTPWNWSKEFARSKYSADMSRLELAYNLGILADAGFETTWGVMLIFVLAARAYPAFVARARQELDEVVGADRLPGFEDHDQLAYVRAVVEETLRWRSMIPEGFPHAAKEEDEYMGYRIPKGATVVPLFWSMCMDEDVWGDPMAFRPERWLDQDVGEEKGGEKERFTSFFGYGRRVCKGRYIASNSLFVLMARVLWAFDIKAPVGEDGRPVEVDDMAFGSAFVSIPEPFEAVFVPRSERAREVVEREWRDTEKDLGVLMEEVRVRQRGMGMDVMG
ncbi:cytochrome P450 oxidoreductase [Aspergillus ellipticus CBS 707.79]|uniref:Cytochrome P450 oxidoreductase n=1 Tax=Aspergillus ellipticus CBS 707.79 TaxID=1448320 RepID=A0A319DMI4_9EURO|nr:cytochrome P450 oxidoreductase [Aspergillus ellipticus CBS 707.79]